MSDQEGLDLALEQARLAASMDEVPVGAILVHDGKVIASGHNLKESSHNPAGHAELLVIQKASQSLQSWRLNDCTLYVTLEPCPMCLAACQQARIARVVYGAPDKKGGAISLGYTLHEDIRLNHRFVVEMIPHRASSEILTQFFKNKRS